MTRSEATCRFFLWLALLSMSAGPAEAQLAPEIGYMDPPGGQPSTTVDVLLGGYDWTPDMQVFVHDPRVKLEITGPPGPVLVPEPPYWFGAKARENDPPLPREIPARLIIAADAPPGPVRWQVANANGASPLGVFWIGTQREVVEARQGHGPQTIDSLPSVVCGQIKNVEEVDHYVFKAAQTGPVTLELFTRRLQTNMNGVLQVRDASGRQVADAADTAGRDLAVTFQTEAGGQYTVSLFDFDFRGDRSFVYRLAITPGPRVLATLPAACQRGTKQTVEFIGYGLVSGTTAVESVKHELDIPGDPNQTALNHSLVTPAGSVTVSLPLTNIPELTEPADAARERRLLTVPSAVTGDYGASSDVKRFWFPATSGQSINLRAESDAFGAGVDVAIAVVTSDGKQLASADDLPTSTDAALDFEAPADGMYEVLLTNQSGVSSREPAIYRLSITFSTPAFELSAPPQLSVPIGGTGVLELKGIKTGGMDVPIHFSFDGLPAGVTPAGELVMPKGAGELKVPLNAAANSAAAATLAAVTAKAEFGGQSLTRTSKVLVTTVLTPPFKITSEGLDDVRKVPRGTTFPAPLRIERSPDFTGEITLEQTSKQQRSRQGITGPDLLVPAGQQRVEYPVFLPEWLETTKTSRMILNGVAKVPDPQGNLRFVVGKMDLRIGMLPQGAMLKLSHDDLELNVRAGEPFEVPIHVSRVAALTEPVRLELVLPVELRGLLEAQAPTVSAEQTSAVLKLVTRSDAAIAGEHLIAVRGTALQHGSLPVVSETSLLVNFLEKK